MQVVVYRSFNYSFQPVRRVCNQWYFLTLFLIAVECKKENKLNARSCVRTRVGVETTIDWTLRSWKSENVLRKKRKCYICVHRERGKCIGCHWWWLNISRGYTKKKASTNRSRKNCANSVSFSIEGREERFA